jgi:hypothetical protein
MKSKDIVVGEDYAYQRWGGRYSAHSGSRERVTVTGVNQKVNVGGRYTWSRDEYKTGLVTFVYATGDNKGEKGYCLPQKIMHSWSEEHGARVSAGKFKADAKREEQATRKQRAEVAFRLHTSLREAGAPVGFSYTYNSEDYAALVDAGFMPATELAPIGDDSTHLRSAVNDLDDLMEKGKVDVGYAAHLLGLSDVPRLHFDHDSYDWDYIKEIS